MNSLIRTLANMPDRRLLALAAGGCLFVALLWAATAGLLVGQDEQDLAVVFATISICTGLFTALLLEIRSRLVSE